MATAGTALTGAPPAGPLAAHRFAGRPVPALPVAAACGSFDPRDPRGREALVDVRSADIAGRNHYARRDGGNAPYHARLPGALDGLWVREGVLARLAAADAGLRATGLRLFVHDAFRPLRVQRAIFDFFVARSARADPAASPAAIEAGARRIASDPRGFDPADPATWPPHCTGGAVDCGLLYAGLPVDCGTGFDEMSPASATAALEAAPSRASPAALARRILFWTMREAGFANYAAEWWHYDLGTRLHAAALAAAGTPGPAWYPPAAPPA